MRESLIERFPVLEHSFFNNSLVDYLVAVGIFVFGMAVLFVLEKFILSKIRKFSEKTTTKVDDFIVSLINKKLLPVFYAIAFFVGAKQLTLGNTGEKVIYGVVISVIVFQVTRSVIAIALRFLEVHSDIRASRGESTATKTMGTVLKLGIWGVGIVFLLDNLGFDVSAVVAGLGIGGVAVALAAQNILGDLFNYFVIFFDKPFREGDFVIVGDFMGTVEHIGIKTTRIRSLSGEQLVFSNSDLTTTRLKNYKRMRERRVPFVVGVTYQTSVDKMKDIPAMIKEIIGKVENVRFDRCHFQSFGDFSLNIETVYYVLDPDYTKFMDVQQEINLAIQEKFTHEGIEFAYPTQTLFVEKASTQV